MTAYKSKSTIKKAVVQGTPHRAVLKPAHAAYRLQHQRFALGDRVTMVQDSDEVPLSLKGVVIGLNAGSMDVVWDRPFKSGVTLSDRSVPQTLTLSSLTSQIRCSQYRGATVKFESCLNLTNPQFIAPKTLTGPTAAAPTTPPNPRTCPYPAVRPASSQVPASGFEQAEIEILEGKVAAARMECLAHPNLTEEACTDLRRVHYVGGSVKDFRCGLCHGCQTTSEEQRIHKENKEKKERRLENLESELENRRELAARQERMESFI